jgi:hypothetical protein
MVGTFREPSEHTGLGGTSFVPVSRKLLSRCGNTTYAQIFEQLGVRLDVASWRKL